MKESFLIDGYCVLKGVIPQNEIAEVYKALLSILIKHRADRPQSDDLQEIAQYYGSITDSRERGRVYDTMTTSPSLQAIFLNKSILDCVSLLLATDLFNLSHFFSCLRIDPTGENPNALDWHQDFQDETVASDTQSDGITVWVPLTDVNSKNGSMQVLPGTHLSRIQANIVQTRKNQSKHIQVILPSESSLDEARLLCLESGDAVFMNMNLLHSTFPGEEKGGLRLTAVGRFFKISSPNFLPGSRRFLPSP